MNKKIMIYHNYNEFHNFSAPKLFLVLRNTYQKIVQSDSDSFTEQLTQSFYPLKKTWRNRDKRHHHYHSFGEFIKDVFQPFYGLGNIIYGLLQWFLTGLVVLGATAISLIASALLLLCITFRFIIPSNTKSNFIHGLIKSSRQYANIGFTSFVLGITDGFSHLLRGAIQLITLPLTWLILIPSRLMAFFYFPEENITANSQQKQDDVLQIFFEDTLSLISAGYYRSTSYSLYDLFRKPFYPLKKTWKNRHHLGTSYDNHKQLLRDILQPLYGIGNITYSLMQPVLMLAMFVVQIPMILFFSLLLITLGIPLFIIRSPRLEKLTELSIFMAFNTSAMVSISSLYSISHMLRGIIQLATTPLTWFILIPSRLYKNYTAPENQKIINFVKEASTTFHTFKKEYEKSPLDYEFNDSLSLSKNEFGYYLFDKEYKKVCQYIRTNRKIKQKTLLNELNNYLKTESYYYYAYYVDKESYEAHCIFYHKTIADIPKKVYIFSTTIYKFEHHLATSGNAKELLHFYYQLCKLGFTLNESQSIYNSESKITRFIFFNNISEAYSEFLRIKENKHYIHQYFFSTLLKILCQINKHEIFTNTAFLKKLLQFSRQLDLYSTSYIFSLYENKAKLLPILQYMDIDSFFFLLSYAGNDYRITTNITTKILENPKIAYLTYAILTHDNEAYRQAGVNFELNPALSNVNFESHAKPIIKQLNQLQKNEIVALYDLFIKQKALLMQIDTPLNPLLNRLPQYLEVKEKVPLEILLQFIQTANNKGLTVDNSYQLMDYLLTDGSITTNRIQPLLETIKNNFLHVNSSKNSLIILLNHLLALPIINNPLFCSQNNMNELKHTIDFFKFNGNKQTLIDTLNFFDNLYFLEDDIDKQLIVTNFLLHIIMVQKNISTENNQYLSTDNENFLRKLLLLSKQLSTHNPYSLNKITGNLALILQHIDIESFFLLLSHAGSDYFVASKLIENPAIAYLAHALLTHDNENYRQTGENFELNPALSNVDFENCAKPIIKQLSQLQKNEIVALYDLFLKQKTLLMQIDIALTPLLNRLPQYLEVKEKAPLEILLQFIQTTNNKGLTVDNSYHLMDYLLAKNITRANEIPSLLRIIKNNFLHINSSKNPIIILFNDLLTLSRKSDGSFYPFCYHIKELTIFFNIKHSKELFNNTLNFFETLYYFSDETAHKKTSTDLLLKIIISRKNIAIEDSQSLFFDGLCKATNIIEKEKVINKSLHSTKLKKTMTVMLDILKYLQRNQVVITSEQQIIFTGVLEKITLLTCDNVIGFDIDNRLLPFSIYFIEQYLINTQAKNVLKKMLSKTINKNKQSKFFEKLYLYFENNENNQKLLNRYMADRQNLHATTTSRSIKKSLLTLYHRYFESHLDLEEKIQEALVTMGTFITSNDNNIPKLVDYSSDPRGIKIPLHVIKHRILLLFNDGKNNSGSLEAPFVLNEDLSLPFSHIFALIWVAINDNNPKKLHINAIEPINLSVSALLRQIDADGNLSKHEINSQCRALLKVMHEAQTEYGNGVNGDGQRACPPGVVKILLSALSNVHADVFIVQSDGSIREIITTKMVNWIRQQLTNHINDSHSGLALEKTKAIIDSWGDYDENDWDKVYPYEGFLSEIEKPLKHYLMDTFDVNSPLPITTEEVIDSLLTVLDEISKESLKLEELENALNKKLALLAQPQPVASEDIRQRRIAFFTQPKPTIDEIDEIDETEEQKDTVSLST